jgi:hypothetical protein
VTPEQAQEIYYKAYAEKMAGREYDKPLVQKELRDESWQAVLEAHRKEIDSEWARELLKRG